MVVTPLHAKVIQKVTGDRWGKSSSPCSQRHGLLPLELVSLLRAGLGCLPPSMKENLQTKSTFAVSEHEE